MTKTLCNFLLIILLSGGTLCSESELETSLINNKLFYPFQPKIDIQNIFGFYVPNPRSDITQECSDAVKGFLSSLIGPELWALEMFDSWGKIPDGFLYGNIHAIGMFEECELLEAEVEVGIGPTSENISFTGKYCSIYYENHNFTLGEHLGSFPGGEKSQRSGPIMAVLLQPIPFSYGTCMPSVCTEEDLEISLNEKLQPLDRKITNIICTGEEDEMDGFDITVLCIIIILFLLVLVGSIIRAIGFNNKILNLFGHFSFSKNMVDIFSYKRRSPNEITCIHGIRAITIVWIMTCHQYQLPINFLFNTFDTLKYQDEPMGQTITNGWLSVDTFFCLSGIMLAYKLLPPLLEKKRINIITIFCNRFLRLAPTIFVLAMFCATLLRYLGWGPHHHMLQAYSLEDCRSYWWTDPLFVDNFVTGGGDDSRIHDCLRQCWFTAVIMQLFIVSPILLLPLKFNWKYGLCWLGFVTFCSMIIPLAITVVYEFPPSPLLTILDLDFYYEYMTKFYLMPWCRAGPWIVGVWAGVILVKMPLYIPSQKWLAVLLTTVGYVIAISLGLIIVLGLYRYNHLGDCEDYEVWVAALYAGFARHAWGVCIAFVVLTCHFGHARLVDDVLSWKGWRPLSRLAFSMYLVSPVVATWWTTVLYVPVYYNYFYKLFEICGVFFLSLLFGLILSVTVERPIMGLFKEFFGPSAAQEIMPKKEKHEGYSNEAV